MFKNYHSNDKVTSDLVKFIYNPSTGFTDVVFWTSKSNWYCRNSPHSGTRYRSYDQPHIDGYGRDDPCDLGKFAPSKAWMFERKV